MKRVPMLGLPVVLLACADGTPTQPASSFGQPMFEVVSDAAAPTAVFHFYACTGTSLTSFDAEKTAVPSAAGIGVSAAGAFQLLDGSAVFIVLSFGEGNFSPPGIALSGSATVTRTVDLRSGTTEFSNFLAPAA